MRVACVVPGSGGGFYCENCLRDLATVRALRKRGVDAVMVPMYLPIQEASPIERGDAPVFFGGLSTYLRHRFPRLRRAPGWLWKLLDSEALLKLAAGRAGTTSADGLGSLTLAMLRGERGEHSDELERLVEWLAESVRPDVVHISSVLLAGLARRIRQSVRCPVVCTLQDEDSWIDSLDHPYDELCWEEMGRRAEQVDMFVTVGEAYGRLMSDRMGIPASKIMLVRVGIDLDAYAPASSMPEPPVMGYLSRLAPALGIDAFVNAFCALKKRPGLERLRMRAMGGILGRDRETVRSLESRLRNEGFERDAEFLPETDLVSRLAFLKTVSVICVPMPAGVAYGTFMVEAWASGVPVVQPRAGGFPELVEMTGGGVLYSPDDPGEPAASLASLLADPARLRTLGAAGRSGVEKNLTLETMAERLQDVYTQAIRKRKTAPGPGAAGGADAAAGRMG